MRTRDAKKLLLIVPGILFLVSSINLLVKGPYYSGYNSDPDYVYLLNSLTILDLGVPAHTDHPGTTLQILGAAVIVGKWSFNCLLGSCPPLQQSVLTDPESYLRIINLVLRLMVCIAAFFVALRFYQVSKLFLTAITFQLSFLLFPEIIKALSTVRPEPLLMFTVLVLTSVLLPVIFTNPQEVSSNSNRKQLLLTGAVLGFGLATKVTFAPLFALVFMYRGIKSKVIVVASTFGAFVFFTLPIITQYPRMISWLFTFLTHRGNYGQGDAGLPQPDVIIANVGKLLALTPSLFALLALFLLTIAALSYWRLKTGSGARKNIQHLLWAGCLVIATQIILTIKQPHSHYMLPAIVFTGLMNAAVIHLLLSCGCLRLNHVGRQLIKVAGVLIFSAGTVFSTSKTYGSMTMLYTDLRADNEIKDEIRKMRQTKSCSVFQYYRASSIQSSLNFGNSFSRWRYRSELAALYPNALFYNNWNGSFHSMDHMISKTTIYKALEHKRCILLYGIPFEDYYQQFQRNLILQPIKLYKHYALYRLVGFQQ